MSVIRTILQKYVLALDADLKNTLTDASPHLRGMVSYHFGWVDEQFQPVTVVERGKMLRPTMNLLVFEAITGDYKACLPVATAIEMIHNFSLIHDDIEDGDRTRRGRATAWTIWGQPTVINAGDFLYSLAYRRLLELEGQFPPDRIFAVMRLINRACLLLTEGQDLDLRFETLDDVSTDMYLDMVFKKTGALIEASILAGAQLATDDARLLNQYYQFAHNIGIAFQIRDDILGIWGDSDKTGKSASNDIRRKKKTYPIIYMLDQTTGAEQAQLKSYYADPDPLSDEQIAFVRECLERTGAYAYAKAAADSYRSAAFDALDSITLDHPAHTELETIAKFLVDRSY